MITSPPGPGKEEQSPEKVKEEVMDGIDGASTESSPVFLGQATQGGNSLSQIQMTQGFPMSQNTFDNLCRTLPASQSPSGSPPTSQPQLLQDGQSSLSISSLVNALKASGEFDCTDLDRPTAPVVEEHIHSDSTGGQIRPGNYPHTNLMQQPISVSPFPQYHQMIPASATMPVSSAVYGPITIPQFCAAQSPAMVTNRVVTPRPLNSVSPELYASVPGVSPMMPPKGDIPETANYEGDFGFQVFIANNLNVVKKSMAYAFSDKLNKLFVSMEKPCPINFKCTNGQPPLSTTVIRAMVIYSGDEELTEIVRRCANHAAKDNCDGNHHIMRAQHQFCRYFDDPNTGRHSIEVPWRYPALGTDQITVFYQFMCYSSCGGTRNHRPMKIIFTLELDGAIRGRQTVNVRICAAVGRDWKQEEDGLVSKKRRGGAQNLDGSMSKKRYQTGAGPEMNDGDGQTSSSDDDEVYPLMIRGKKMHKIVFNIYKGILKAQLLKSRGEDQTGESDQEMGF